MDKQISQSAFSAINTLVHTNLILHCRHVSFPLHKHSLLFSLYICDLLDFPSLLSTLSLRKLGITSPTVLPALGLFFEAAMLNRFFPSFEKHIAGEGDVNTLSLPVLLPPGDGVVGRGRNKGMPRVSNTGRLVTLGGIGVPGQSLGSLLISLGFGTERNLVTVKNIWNFENNAIVIVLCTLLKIIFYYVIKCESTM